MIVRLKAIESREDIFCYLSFYNRSRSRFPRSRSPSSPFHHQAIESSSPRVAASWSRLSARTSARRGIDLSRHRIVRKPLNHRILESLRGPLGIEASSRRRSCCAFGSSSSCYPNAVDQLRRIVFECGRAIFVIELLYGRSVSTPTLTPSECLVDKPRWRIRSTIIEATINFSHSRRVDHSSGCMRRSGPQLHHLEDAPTRSSCHWVPR